MILGRLSSAFWDKDEVSMDAMDRFILHTSKGLLERVVAGGIHWDPAIIPSPRSPCSHISSYTNQLGSISCPAA